MALSICRGCHLPLGSSHFRTNGTRGTGREAYCRDCANQARRLRRKVRTRERFFAQFGQRYCRYCGRGKPPTAFSVDRSPLPPMCDTCLAAWTQAAPRAPQTAPTA